MADMVFDDDDMHDDVVPNIGIQLKKAMDSPNGYTIRFKDGSRLNMSKKDAYRIMCRYMAIKPYAREEFQNNAIQGAEAFEKAVEQI